jgi:hypothetical protein
MTKMASCTDETMCPQHIQEFLFLYVGHMLKSYWPLKCTNLVKFVRELRIALYIYAAFLYLISDLSVPYD